MGEDQTSQRDGGEDLVLTVLPVDSTGVPRLDPVLGGGIPRGALVIIVGPPGSGKTTLANQMAFAAARGGRRAMVLTVLSEPTSKLIAHLSSFNFYDDDLVGDTIQFHSVQQFLTGGLEATGDEIVAEARRTRASFAVLDGIRGIRGIRGADVSPQAARQFLYDVGTTLSVLGTTTVITSESDPRDPYLVLIAEDEQPIAEALAMIVADAGCTPLIASQGKQALELTRAQHPALPHRPDGAAAQRCAIDCRDPRRRRAG